VVTNTDVTVADPPPAPLPLNVTVGYVVEDPGAVTVTPTTVPVMAPNVALPVIVAVGNVVYEPGVPTEILTTLRSAVAAAPPAPVKVRLMGPDV
jgi:hypothetical protein